MVSDFGLSRDVYEIGEYESTSGVWTVFSYLKNGKSCYNDKVFFNLLFHGKHAKIRSSSYIVLQRFFPL